MKNLRIDSQVLTSMSHCPLRCKYTFKDRLVTAGENRNFALGKVIHVGLESYYKGIMEALPFKDRKDTGILSANNYAVTNTNLEGADIETCIQTLDQYFSYRREDRIDVIAVEVPFSKLLYEGKDLRGEEIKIFYEGKIDLVAREEVKEVVDHKTTNRNFEPVSLRNQFLGYHWATDLQVVMNRIGFQKSLAPSEKFKRFPFRYEPQVVKAWEKFAIQKSLEYALYLEEDEFPPNFGACEGSYGFPCTYINLCRYPSLEKETKEFEFTIGEPWDVFKEVNS